MHKVSPKRLKFVSAYIQHFNGTKACIDAGYSKSCARVTASRLLANDNIRQLIDQALEESYEFGLVVLKAKVLLELEQLSFSRLSDYLDEDCEKVELSKVNGSGAVKELVIDESVNTQTKQKTRKIRIKLHDKDRSLAMLSKITGLSKDEPTKVELPNVVFMLPEPQNIDNNKTTT